MIREEACNWVIVLMNQYNTQDLGFFQKMEREDLQTGMLFKYVMSLDEKPASWDTYAEALAVYTLLDNALENNGRLKVKRVVRISGYRLEEEETE